MLRVLVVLPLYGGSLPVGRYCIEGLKEAGCVVDSFEAPNFYSAYSAIKELRVDTRNLDALQGSFLRMMGQAVVAKVEAFAPDLVLAMAQAPLSRHVLQRLKRDNIPTAMWFVEDFRLFTYWRAFAPLYDIFAVIQKGPFLEELDKINVANTLYLPLGALPSVHRPMELTPKEKSEFGADVSFMGAGYPNRRKAFAQFADQGFKIWGSDWEDEPRLKNFIQREGERVSTDDCIRIFNATGVNINLHSSVNPENPVNHGDFVNPRTFEIAACGGFQLVDERELLPELFRPDEIVTFSTVEEVKEKIAYYRNHPQERAAIAAKARERVLNEHTYAHRMRTLLDFVRERVPTFGVRHQVSWPESMPEDMRTAITRLLLELGLPQSVGFDELVTAVRTKSNVLSDVETALLFLDEWKKLYNK